MTPQEIKRVNQLKSAFNTLINNCYGRWGIPKSPTQTQLINAIESLNKFIRESKLNEL